MIRLLVSRAHIDLRDICIAYKGFYKKSLESDIKSDTSGDYRKLLLALISKWALKAANHIEKQIFKIF